MAEPTKADVVRALLVSAELYQREFSEAAARLLVEDLAEFPPGAVLQALSRCRKELRTFPTVSEIAGRIPGCAIDPKHQAQLIAGKILKCITRLGPYKAREVHAELGDVGWEVVQQSGGWETICSLTDRDVSMNRAQWVRLSESLLESGFTDRPKQIEQTPPGAFDVKKLLRDMPEEEK